MHDDSFELDCGWLDDKNHSRLTTARKLPPVRAGPAFKSFADPSFVRESYCINDGARCVDYSAPVFASLPYILRYRCVLSHIKWCEIVVQVEILKKNETRPRN